MAYYEALNAELTESGELVGGEALSGAEMSKIVRSDGRSAPVVTDGPYAEAKEQLQASRSSTSSRSSAPSRSPPGCRRFPDQVASRSSSRSKSARLWTKMALAWSCDGRADQ